MMGRESVPGKRSMREVHFQGDWLNGLRAFRVLFPYLKEFRAWLLLGIFSLAVVDFLQLCIPLIIKWAVDDLTLGRATSAGLLRYAGWILLLALGIGVFRYVWRLSLMTPTRRVEERLRNRIFQHILSLSEDFFMAMPSGDIMARVVNDLNVVRMAVGFGMVGLMDAFVMGAATLVFMVWISRSLTAYVLIPMPFLVMATALISRRIHWRAQEVQRQFSVLTETVREGISGIRVIRAAQAERAQGEKVEREGRHLLQKNLALAKVRGVFFPVLMLLVNLSMVIVLYFGGRDTILARISPGDFVAFTNYLMLLTWPMMAMGWVISLIQRGAASLGRINELLHSRPSLKSGKRHPSDRETREGIEARGVSFAYPGGRDILTDCSLRVAPRKVTALVGEIGCGKTTLLLLLMRLFDPKSGVISLGGRDIRTFDLDAYRRCFSYVSQEPVVFSETIFQNVAMGREDLTKTEAAEILKVAHLFEEVEGFPRGMETVVGERGVTLSGGQRQRLALARALAARRPFLVLDSPFSSVDVATEREILAAIRARYSDLTIIMSSQRLATFMKADWIYLMSRGTIQASGSHDELLKQSEAYRMLVREITFQQAFQTGGTPDAR